MAPGNDIFPRPLFIQRCVIQASESMRRQESVAQRDSDKCPVVRPGLDLQVNTVAQSRKTHIMIPNCRCKSDPWQKVIGDVFRYRVGKWVHIQISLVLSWDLYRKTLAQGGRQQKF